MVRMSTSWSRRSLHGLRISSSTSPEPDHEPALGQALGVQFLGVAEHLKRPPVLGLRTDRRVETRDRLDVVVEGVGSGVYDGLYSVPVTLEVGGKNLDGAARDLVPDRAYRPREDGGAPV